MENNKNYFNAFINTSFNKLSIRYHCVSQPNKELIFNNESKYNPMHLLPITFGIIYILNLHCIKLTNFQISSSIEILLKLEGFKYATSLDHTMGYYHMTFCPISWTLCTIV